MRHLAILCLAGLLVGCGILTYTSFTPVSNMDYALKEENGWRILLPEELRRMNKENLPYWEKYSFHEDARSLFFEYEYRYNYFFAKYVLPDNKEIALWISITGALSPTKLSEGVLFGTPGIPVTYLENYGSERCEDVANAGIIAAFNTLDADFESDSLYLVINGRKVRGEHIQAIPRGLHEAATHAPAKYNLASPETISKMQPVLRGASPNNQMPPLKYPVFNYRFPVTCMDFENAVLVIDGLYYQGNRLPPLKVRTWYMDFSKVPRYAGPPADKER